MDGGGHMGVCAAAIQTSGQMDMRGVVDTTTCAWNSEEERNCIRADSSAVCGTVGWHSSNAQCGAVPQSVGLSHTVVRGSWVGNGRIFGRGGRGRQIGRWGPHGCMCRPQYRRADRWFVVSSCKFTRAIFLYPGGHALSKQTGRLFATAVA